MTAGNIALGPALLVTAIALGEAAVGPPDKHLEYFVGAWEVEVTFRLPDGTEGRGSATCEAQAILGGAFLQQDYESTFWGERLVIRQVLGYDDLRRSYVQFQLHEGGGVPTQTRRLEGGFGEDSAVLTLAGDAFDGFTGAPVGIRTVTRIVDHDHYVVDEWFRAAQGPEELVVVLHHTREARSPG